MPSFTSFTSILDFLILPLFRHVSAVLLRFIRPSLTGFDEIVEQPGNWDREAPNPGHGYLSAQLYRVSEFACSSYVFVPPLLSVPRY